MHQGYQHPVRVFVIARNAAQRSDEAIQDVPVLYVRWYMNDNETKTFYNLETSLHKKEVRNSRDTVSSLLADDFLEFGRSGRMFEKQDIIAGLEQEAVDLEITVSDFAARKLAEDVVLVTYTASMLDEDHTSTIATRRSSVWVLQDGNWKMTFHQGTKVAS